MPRYQILTSSPAQADVVSGRMDFEFGWSPAMNGSYVWWTSSLDRFAVQRALDTLFGGRKFTVEVITPKVSDAEYWHEQVRETDADAPGVFGRCE